MCKKGFSFKFAAYVLFLLTLSNFSLANKIIYVDDDANGINDGSSWQNAYKYLQDALADANSSEKPLEIRVAQGTYKPDQGAGQTAGDRDASFVLINNVILSGGYAGISEADPNELNIEKYVTILSGDLAGNDIDINDIIRELHGLQNEPTWAENSYHVLKSIGTDSSSVLDGFTITSGHANGYYLEISSKGGGIYNENSQCTIINCKFFKNAGIYGGGIYNNNSNPIISDSYFESNLAYIFFYGDTGIGGNGGGITNSQSNPMIENCIFKGNLEGAVHNLNNSEPVFNDCEFVHNFCNQRRGAGMYSKSSSPTLSNCRFEENLGSGMYNDTSTVTLNNCIFIKNNSKFYEGGAIKNYRSNIIISHCLFINNMSYGSGGAIYNSDNRDNRDSSLSIKNCIFSGNTSRDVGGGAFSSSYGCSQTFENCIFFGNKAKSYGSAISGSLNSIYVIKNSIFRSNYSRDDSVIYLWKIQSNEGPSSVSVSYSNLDSNSIFIGGGNLLEWKEGNIDVDPLFANPGLWDPNGTPNDANDDFWIDGDYHLKSQAGRFDPNTQTWVQDNVTSPCIDAGDPNSPIGLDPFPNGGRINMGAYGGTSEASKSYFGKPVCETVVAGDINGDCRVDILDLEIMMSHWLEEH